MLSTNSWILGNQTAFNNNNTLNNVTAMVDFFCGVDGGLSLDALWIYRNGIFLSDCFRELFIVGLPHALYLVFVWYRFVSLFYEPKWFTFKEFFTTKRIPVTLKLLHMLRLGCVLLCFFLLDIKLVYAIISKEFSIATVNYVIDTIKIVSWLACLCVTYMEMTRNRKIWLASRLFWIGSLFAAVIKQVSYIQDLKIDGIFSAYVLDIVEAVLNFFLILSTMFLAILGCFGTCTSKWLETYSHPEDNERMNKLKVDRVHISVKDALQLFFDGWYLIIPGLIFAAAQGVFIIELAEVASEFVTAAQEQSIETFNNALMYLEF